MVLSRYRRAFAEVDFDRPHTELQQISEFPLIPLHCFGITHVERCILERELTAFILNLISFLYYLFPQIILAGEVSVLPETDMKALVFQIGDHLRRILEP